MGHLHLLPIPAGCHSQCVFTHCSDSWLWISGHNFPSAGSALFNLFCHYLSWPSPSSVFHPPRYLIIQIVHSWCSPSTRSISLLALKILPWSIIVCPSSILNCVDEEIKLVEYSFLLRKPHDFLTRVLENQCYFLYRTPRSWSILYSFTVF